MIAQCRHRAARVSKRFAAWFNKSLQKRWSKRPREKFFQLDTFSLAVQIDQQNFDIAAKFPKDLAARSAGGCESIRVGGNGDSQETASAFGHGFEDGHPLRADCQSVSRVLDIAAGVHAACRIFERRANAEMRIRRMCVFAGRECGGGQGIEDAHLSELE